MPSEPEPAPSRVLVLFAHPALERSRVNRRLVDAARDVRGVTVRDLYELYPEFDVDVEAEQAALLEHDIVVLQHPFYWYSVPALMKQWIDLVLEHGWAYGHDGTALHGKGLCSAVTVGGQEEVYRPEGYNHYPVRDLLRPIEQTARLCGMRYGEPFLVYGTLRLRPDDVAVEAERYARWLAEKVTTRDLARGTEARA